MKSKSNRSKDQQSIPAKKSYFSVIVAVVLGSGAVHADLVGHWNLEEGSGTTTVEAVSSTVSDAFGAGVSWSTDSPGPASGSSLSFPGTGAGNLRSNLNAATLGINGSSSKTISGWIKCGDTAGVTRMFFGWSPTDGSPIGADLRLGLDGSGFLRFEVSGGFALYGTTALDDNSWHMVGVVIDANDNVNSVQFYIDGNLVNPTSAGDRLIATAGSSADALRDDIYLGIGNPAGPQQWAGLLDDLRVHNTSLTEIELDSIRDAMSVAPPTPLIWNNSSGNGLWDAVSLNWDDGVADVAFENGDELRFEDTLGLLEEVEVFGTVAPAKITFSNVATDYEFGGAGTIGGSGPLFANNGGWVTFANTGGLSFSGSLQVSGTSRVILQTAGNHGSSIITAGSSIGLMDGASLVGPVQNNGTLFNESISGTQTVSGVISGNGGIQQLGDGNFVLNAVNTHTGTVTIDSGVFRLAPGAKLYQTGTFFGAQNQNYIIVNTGGVFETWNWNFSDANSLSRLRHNYGQILLNGGTIRFTESFTSQRAFTVGANGGSIEVGPGITYTKPAGTIVDENIIRFSAGSTLTLGGAGDVVIGDALGSYGVTGFSIGKTGDGTLTLSGSCRYTGNTTVTAGSLFLNSTGALTFAPGANGVSNQISGAGSATFNGRFIFNLAGADTTPANSWVIASVASQLFDATSFSVSDGTNVFSESSPGIHRFDDGTRVWTFTEASGMLSVAASPAGGYGAWAAANAPTGNSADDYDMDGVPNGVEYLLGGLATTNDANRLPAVSTPVGNLVFSFLKDATITDATWSIEVGTGLDAWPSTYEAGDPEVLVELAAEPGFDRVTLTLTQTPDSKKFARLRVTTP